MDIDDANRDRDPGRSVTLRDVAADANVSVAAVSRAFTPGARISEELRARVMRSAEKLGYRPSRLARALSRTRSDLVALLIGDLATSSFDSLFIDAVLDMVSRQDRHTMVLKVGGADQIGAALDMAEDYSASAVIVAAGTMSDALSRRFEEVDVPLILAGRAVPSGRALSVVSDNVAGAAGLTRHVLLGGARRIAYVGRVQRVFCDTERVAGVRQALAQAGENLFAEWRVQETSAAGAQLRDLLASEPRPDALVCFNDRLALAALEAARRLGIAVPDALRVTGYDDIPEAGWDSFRLTTVAQRVGSLIAPIERVLSGDPRPTQGGIVRVPAPLVIRDTA